MIKKFLRCWAFVVAFGAVGTIVLHSAHLDAEHYSTTTSHNCIICQTATKTPAPVVQLSAPVLIFTTALPFFKVVKAPSRRISDQDPRGPPLV